MIKILTFVNFAAFLLGVAGLGGAYIYRSKIVDALIKEVEKQIPAMVEEFIPETPKMTGVALPL